MENLIVDFTSVKNFNIGSLNADITIKNEMLSEKQLNIELDEHKNVILKNLDKKNNGLCV